MADDDWDFGPFAKGKRTATAKKNVATAAQQNVRLAPPARKANLAERRAGASKVEAEKARNLARSLAMGGISAVQQAEEHADRLDREQRQRIAQAQSASAAASAQFSPDSMEKLRAITNAPNALDTYRAASALEQSYSSQDAKTGLDDRLLLQAWAIVEAKMRKELEKPAVEQLLSSEHIARARMTALSRLAFYQERIGQLRMAMNHYETLIAVFQTGLACKRRDDLRKMRRILQKTTALRMSIGSTDKAAEWTSAVARLDRLLAATAAQRAATAATTAVSAAGTVTEEKLAAASAAADSILAAVTGGSSGATSSSKEETETAAEESAAAESSDAPAAETAAAEAPPSAAATAATVGQVADGTDIQEAPSQADNSSNAEAAAIVSEPPRMPTVTDVIALLTPPADAAPGSPDALFLNAMKAAMVDHDFRAMKELLNKSLLGDKTCSAALTKTVPGIGLTPLLVAAAEDAAAIARQILGLLPRSELKKAILQVKDAAGNNAITTAATFGSQLALHELLLSLHDAGAAPAPLAEGDKFGLVGMTTEQARELCAPHARSPTSPSGSGSSSTASNPVLDQLAKFVFDPARYAREYRPPLVAKAATAGGAPQQLPLAPMAPAGARLQPLLPPAAAGGPPFPGAKLPSLLGPGPAVFPPAPQGLPSSPAAMAAWGSRGNFLSMASAAGLPPVVAAALWGSNPMAAMMMTSGGGGFPLAPMPPLPPGPHPLQMQQQQQRMQRSPPPPQQQQTRGPGPRPASGGPQKPAAPVIVAGPGGKAQQERQPQQAQPQKAQKPAQAAAPSASSSSLTPSNVSVAAGQGKLVGRQLEKMELEPLPSAASSSSSVLVSASGKGGDNKAAASSTKTLAQTLEEMALEDDEDEGGEELEASSAAATADSKPGTSGGGKEKSKKKGGKPAWDQFAANEALFGVKSDTYRPELYTSALDASKYTPQQIAAAERLAAEILANDTEAKIAAAAKAKASASGSGAGKGAGHDSDSDEEGALHSDVLPSGSASSSSAAAAGGLGDTFTDAGVKAKQIAKK